MNDKSADTKCQALTTGNNSRSYLKNASNAQ